MIQKRGARWRVVVQGRRDELSGKRHQLSGSAETELEAVSLERRPRLVLPSSSPSHCSRTVTPPRRRRRRAGQGSLIRCGAARARGECSST